ncbi:hypothetical protein B0H10DRAFT_359005 [Mycena sp. CBHHK59/15]|nr:hypothetical protein B0H10DRAFT_359005 [Mycena sp. CBHHK59/15]
MPPSSTAGSSTPPDEPHVSGAHTIIITLCSSPCSRRTQMPRRKKSSRLATYKRLSRHCASTDHSACSTSRQRAGDIRRSERMGHVCQHGHGARCPPPRPTLRRATYQRRARVDEHGRCALAILVAMYRVTPAHARGDAPRCLAAHMPPPHTPKHMSLSACAPARCHPRPAAPARACAHCAASDSTTGLFFGTAIDGSTAEFSAEHIDAEAARTRRCAAPVRAAAASSRASGAAPLAAPRSPRPSSPPPMAMTPTKPRPTSTAVRTRFAPCASAGGSRSSGLSRSSPRSSGNGGAPSPRTGAFPGAGFPGGAGPWDDVLRGKERKLKILTQVEVDHAPPAAVATAGCVRRGGRSLDRLHAPFASTARGPASLAHRAPRSTTRSPRPSSPPPVATTPTKPRPTSTAARRARAARALRPLALEQAVVRQRWGRPSGKEQKVQIVAQVDVVHAALPAAIRDRRACTMWRARARGLARSRSPARRCTRTSRRADADTFGGASRATPVRARWGLILARQAEGVGARSWQMHRRGADVCGLYVSPRVCVRRYPVVEIEVDLWWICGRMEDGGRPGVSLSPTPSTSSDGRTDGSVEERGFLFMR